MNSLTLIVICFWFASILSLFLIWHDVCIEHCIYKELTGERKTLNGIFREKGYFCSGPSCAAFLCFVMSRTFMHVFLKFVMTPSCLFSCVLWWHISIQSMLSLNLYHKLTSGIIGMLHHAFFFLSLLIYLEWKVKNFQKEHRIRSQKLHLNSVVKGAVGCGPAAWLLAACYLYPK